MKIVLAIRHADVSQICQFVFIRVANKEREALRIHIEEYDRGQEHHREEWSKNVLLVYCRGSASSRNHGIFSVVACLTFWSACAQQDTVVLSFSQFRM